jgi:hypothetical protein
MRLAGHIARLDRGRMFIGYWWESQKEREYKEEKDLCGWIILRWILERQDGGIGWISLAQDREKRRALVSMVVNIRFT